MSFLGRGVSNKDAGLDRGFDSGWIRFEVPTPAGLVNVGVPADMSAADAEVAAARVAAVIRAMFAVVDSDAPRLGSAS